MTTEIVVTMNDGTRLPWVQAVALARLIEKHEGDEKLHWHPNDCGCCMTLHGSDYAYVINAAGEAEFFPERGCNCH